jgi:integrase
MSPLSKKLTLSAVEDLEPGVVRWDGQIKGFGAQGNQNGTVTFVVKTRVLGRQRWVTIGRLGSPWTVETARREALRILSEAAAGRDPVESKRARQADTTRFEGIVEDFLAQHGTKLKQKSLSSYRGLFDQHIKPALGDRRISEINRADVAKLHARHASKPRTANYAVAVLSKMMSWAEQQGLRPDGSNPCRRIEKYKEIKRDRFLSPEEFARLGSALSEVERTAEQGTFIIAAIRLLILTGARLSEVLTLKWSYVDEHRRALVLPDSKTGAKTIPLNQHALNVLASLPRMEHNPYVLPGQITGKHLVNLQKPWRAIRKRAGLDDVRLHDLRHSFASMGVSVGGSLPVIGRVLGHTQPQTTARYAHVADKLASDLVEAAGAQIAEAMKMRQA